MKNFAIVLALLVASAAGAYEQPGTGNKAEFALVNGYKPCAVADVNTNLLINGAGACAPPVASGPCAFGSNGSGKLTFKKIGSSAQGTEDVQMTAAAKGLDGSCEGLLLWIQLSIRVSTNNCVAGSCTEVDLDDLQFANTPCVVREGKCKIKTTMNTTLPGYKWIPNGSNTGVQILACGLHSGAHSLFDPPDLSCGVLVR